MRTAIVMVSYNGERWLGQALLSCQRFAPEAPVYVVDNASADGSARLVEQSFPTVRLIREQQNLGFAGGNNVGIQQAMNDGAEAVMLLNQDAELTEGALSRLVAVLAHSPTVAAVQPAIFLPNGQVNSLGNCFHYLGFGFAGGYQATYAEAEARLPWLKAGTEPPYLSCAAVLIRSSALRQCGLFDEELFMYHEDLELCFRFRLAGLALAVCPEAKVVHYYEFHRSTQSYYFMERNRFVVWLSYFKPQTLAFIIVLWLLSEVPLLLVAIFQGWAAEKLKAYAYVLRPRTWVGITHRRRQLRTLGKLSDREMLRYASASVTFQEVESPVVDYVFNPVSRAVWWLLYPLIRS